ncbi:MAG: hypothetical protein LBJ86_02255 [Spirochaetaceae bacterium]|jgi:hypothetical protein|nr:hypothetical protein [Spirochaetaceae bacterium]
MFKRYLFVSCFIAAIAGGAYGYDAAPYGENIFLLGFPRFVSSAASTTGGGLYDAGPYSININPALTAPLQRVAVDLGGTMLLTKDDGGTAFHAGALVPSRWGVWTGDFDASFIPVPLSPPGHAISAHFGWARDIVENLYVGVSIFAGGVFKYGNDFALGFDAGFVYKLGKLGFLKDARASAVFAGIGKTFTNDVYKNFPGMFTPKGGFAAVLYESGKFAAGFSVDLAVPSFQNAVLGVGLDFNVFKIIDISAGWDMNIRELADKRGAHTPFVGITVRLTKNTSSSDILMKRGWDKTDINIYGVYQRLNDEINLFSAGASAHFGAIDRSPPVIEMGEAE